MEESDEEMEDKEGPQGEPEQEEEEDEIIESDIELEGEVVEPDNDPPQKVFFGSYIICAFDFIPFIVSDNYLHTVYLLRLVMVFGVCRWVTP